MEEEEQANESDFHNDDARKSKKYDGGRQKSPKGQAGAEDATLFNDKVIDITIDAVTELIQEWRPKLASSKATAELADKITRLAYLNMSLGFTKTSKMMAYVIIEHEKKIEKLQDMCLKLEKLAEHYRSRLTEVLEETKGKIEEFQIAFRTQEVELERLKSPIETYDYTLDRISKRFELVERSIDAISERPSNIHISHLLPPATKQIDYKRGISLNFNQVRYQQPEADNSRLLGRGASQGRTKEEVLRQKIGGMASYGGAYDPTSWLGDYLHEKGPLPPAGVNRRGLSARLQSSRVERTKDVVRNLDSELSQRPGQFLDSQQPLYY